MTDDFDPDGWRERYDPLAEQPLEIYIPAKWTAEHAGFRIVEAFEITDMLPRVGGPAGFKSTMPAYYHDAQDLWFQRDLTEAEKAERENEKNHTRVRPTAEQYTRLGRVLDWMLLLSGAGRPVRVIRDWACERARSESREGFPIDELEWLAGALNARGEAVF